MKAVTVCDLYSLDRSDFDIILQKFPKMKRIMQNVAEERLAQLRDTYGPGWMGNEHSETDIDPNQLNSSGASLIQRQCRIREYLRRVEASRATSLQQSSSAAMYGHISRSSRSTQSCVGGANGRGLQAVGSSHQTHTPSSDSVQIDLPTFTRPEDAV